MIQSRQGRLKASLDAVLRNFHGRPFGTFVEFFRRLFGRVPMGLRLTQGDENRVSACALLAAWDSRSQRRARV
jgi:hypothetical protein